MHEEDGLRGCVQLPLNDADGDLVCDELEVDGCTDETHELRGSDGRRHACTQKPTTTVMAEFDTWDEDGVCDELEVDQR